MVARIEPLAADEWTPELREAYQPDGREPVELDVMGIQARMPRSALAFMRASGSLRREGTLPNRLLELVRLRIAFFNQCRSCMAIRYRTAVDDGVSEDLVCSLERPVEAADLTEAERVAVRYGELMATDHLAIDETVFAELRRHFSDAQIVELGMWAANCVGFGRLAATWRATDHLAERFRADGPVTPWGGGELIVG